MTVIQWLTRIAVTRSKPCRQIQHFKCEIHHFECTIHHLNANFIILNAKFIIFNAQFIVYLLFEQLVALTLGSLPCGPGIVQHTAVRHCR